MISDHCPISMTFVVPAAGLTSADWAIQDGHVRKSGGCGSRMSLMWRSERAEVYAEVLAENTEMHAQFEQAITDENHEVACFCLRSITVQAASDYRVGMAGQISVCGPLRVARKGAHSPPWFDAVCKETRRAFTEALNTGQPLHACAFLQKQ